MTTYRLNELFWSIQGEGTHAGRTAVFVRLQGCPVGCPWCDSKLTWYAGGEPLNADAIAARVRMLPSDLVVITGGEPLLYDLDDLLTALIPLHRPVHLETSGALPVKGRRHPAHVVVSPKAAAAWRIDPTVLLWVDELKYVVDEAFDPAVVADHLALLPFAVPVLLMPEGSPPRAAMVARTLALLRDQPTWRFGPRLQYAYPAIADGEGLNNKIVTVAEARQRARETVATHGH